MNTERQHPDQAEPAQSLDERQPCHVCELPTYNFVEGQPQCLHHHGRHKDKR